MPPGPAPAPSPGSRGLGPRRSWAARPAERPSGPSPGRETEAHGVVVFLFLGNLSRDPRWRAARSVLESGTRGPQGAGESTTDCRLLWGQCVRAVGEQPASAGRPSPASPVRILRSLPGPHPAPRPTPHPATDRSPAPDFSKSQSNGWRWRPARAASLDPAFRTLDLGLGLPSLGWRGRGGD